MQNAQKMLLNRFINRIRFLISKNRTASLFALAMIYGCNPVVTDSDLDKLNGYWIIKNVTFADNSKKEFGLSNTVDYFEFSDTTGFRKKMQPRLDGSYATSDDAIEFSLKQRNGKYYLNYSGESASWTEWIKKLNEKELILVSDTEIVYYYTRFQPLELD